MSDQKSNEKAQEKAFIKSLRSGNRTAILSTLKDIRSGGMVTILTEVFDLLVDQEDDQIYHEAVSLINDLKSKESVPFLVEAIKNPEYEPIRQELVASCWQSGLSYSSHIRLFIDVALHDKYATAIEAFTVIEDSIGNLEENELKKQITYLKENVFEADQNKQLLLKELIKIMETY